MIAIDVQIVLSAIAKHKTEIDSFSKDAKSRLETYLRNPERTLKKEEKDYLNDLVHNIENLVIAIPEDLEIHKTTFPAVPLKIIRKKKKNKKGKWTFEKVNDFTFRDKIIELLDYKGLRNKFLPKFYSDIGIKSCVYCNSMLTVSANSYADLNNRTNLIVKAKFQADHSISKSRFPSLSISLFNLFPVCGPCNNVKGDKEVPFVLYSSNAILMRKSNYSFELKKGCVAKYLASKDASNLEVYFNDPLKMDRSMVAKGSLQDTFDIEGIYETQIDLVEELIHKAEVYKDSYKEKLAKSFYNLFTHASLSNRILIGNYTKINEIHKRPMAKFTQDIAKQLGLI